MKSGSLPHFDAVIATRNRPQALAMSIPLLINQKEKPRNLIVVDSSDDHDNVSRVVEDSARQFKGRLEIVKSPRGSSLQRNIGLRYVKEEVVFFPDDDSMFHPGASESILRIYQLDTENTVGGVCGAQSLSMPAENVGAKEYESTPLDELKKRLTSAKRYVERTFAPDPFLTVGNELISTRTAPGWLSGENAVLVEFMTGYRMTYRTESIVKQGFNETFLEYGLYEDTDASFGVLKNQHLVGARNAQIYHHRFPGARASGRFMGIANILNRAYVIAKHAPYGSKAREQLARYNHYTVLRYLLGIDSTFGRERIRGAYDALDGARMLLQSDIKELDDCYKKLWSRYTQSRS